MVPSVAPRRCLAAGLILLMLPGCASVRYYAHVTHGELRLLARRQPIARVLGNPATDPQLAARLALAQEARAFASQRLGLPRNRSYTRYVQLDRPYVAWNVFATPPYSVHAVPQCFPFAGCVAYRGYFDRDRAEQQAARLRRQGDDVWIGPVPAFSTLGWFADPIVSSMLRWDDDQLVGTIFHELAHQRVYVKGDTAFNESFATFVQREGLRQWRASRGLPPPDRHAQAMEEGFTALVLDLRRRLEGLYASTEDVAVLARGKASRIASFRERYRAWRAARWPDDHRYDAWVDAPINNARLLPFGLYDRWTGAFAALFGQVGGDWPRFYARVRALAGQPGGARDAALGGLAAVDRADGSRLGPADADHPR